jgi:hypothetical protein
MNKRFDQRSTSDFEEFLWPLVKKVELLKNMKDHDLVEMSNNLKYEYHM